VKRFYVSSSLSDFQPTLSETPYKATTNAEKHQVQCRTSLRYSCQNRADSGLIANRPEFCYGSLGRTCSAFARRTQQTTAKSTLPASRILPPLEHGRDISVCQAEDTLSRCMRKSRIVRSSHASLFWKLATK
jgi:hypothetical protein